MSDVLAHRASTFSKGPEFWSGDPDWEPKEIVCANGARVRGSDGRWYLDWVSGLGAIACGYPNNASLEHTPANVWALKVGLAVWNGVGYSLPHTSEAQVADRLTTLLSAHVPGWQHEPLGMRWVKTGSDACEAAIRMARLYVDERNTTIGPPEYWPANPDTFTKQAVISVGYHGWHANFVSLTPPAHGVEPQCSIDPIPYGDYEQLEIEAEAEGCALAAVIIEQPPQPIPEDYWRKIRALCDKFGALLIVDEVVTGFRYALGGACERFGIEPDMVCVGKALGNGLPIAAVVGRRDIFTKTLDRHDPVFISSTSFGDAVSLAGASAVLDVWDQSRVDHIWKIGGKLMDGLSAVGYKVTGYPPVSLIEHESDSHRAYFISAMRDRGILMNRPNIPNLAHTVEDVAFTLDAAREVKALMDATDVESEMAGKLPAVLFRGR